MILVDTSVLVDYLRGNNTVIDSLFETEELATCGIILAELLHGTRTEKEKSDVAEAMAEFHWVRIDESTWKDVGDNLNLLRKGGLTIPFQDAVIATICISEQITLLTNDGHFEEIAALLPKLTLYR